MQNPFGKNIHIILVLAAATLLLSACAQQGYPSGGPKDTQPPVVKSVTPASGTTQFGKRQFLINFDEYVQVKDASSNILVSPPMKHKPDYTPKGKGLLVTINDTLLENTTYLFQFRGGIVDFNEGNALPVYDYVFSTGSSIDSMTLCGKVVEAFTAKPYKEDVTLLAYPDSVWTDSAVVLQQPLYVTRCDKKGFFQFNHIRAGRYRIIALEDGDRNLRLGNDEASAFIESAADAEPMPVVDTTLPAPRLDTVSMLLSAPQHEKQRLEKAEMPARGNAKIVTHLPMHNPVVQCSAMHSSVLSRSRDTLTVWTFDSDCDSLRLIVTDSVWLADTLTLRYTERKQKNPLAGRKKTDFPKSLPSGKRDYFDTLWIRFDSPAGVAPSASRDSLVQVLDLADSTISWCGIAWDSAMLNARICFEGKPGGRYQFRIAEKQFADYWKHVSDSIIFTTELTPVEDYGSLLLDIQCEEFHSGLIVELIDEDGTVFARERLAESGKRAFPHLKAGKYTFRAIWDSNGDGQWTPGDYWLHRQPEQVLYFHKTLDLRSNWQMEETWSF